MAKSKISIRRRTKLATRKGRIQRHINKGEATVVSYIAPKGVKLLAEKGLGRKLRKTITEKYTKNRYKLVS
jgi:hypothetical protein